MFNIKYVLTLDIGGTNPRMAVVEVLGIDNYKIIEKRDINKEKDSIIEDINNFLRDLGNKDITTDVCCVSVAGPVDVAKNECIHLVNAKFPIIGSEIEEKTALKNVLVINDFRAIGEAVATLNLDEKDDRIVQIPGYKDKDYSRKPDYYVKPDIYGNRAVIGPGTGLGIAYIVRTDSGYVLSASEGGHSGLPVHGDFTLLFHFLRNKLNVKHIDMEALVSGQGIRHIMDFFLTHQHAFLDLLASHPEFLSDFREYEKKVHKEIISDEEIRKALIDEKENPLKVDAAKLIATSIKKNPKARITMRVFMIFLGSAAQDVALHGLSTGGLFLAGGILPKNEELLKNGDFIRAFYDNTRTIITDLLRKIPVYLVKDYDIPFYGCARAAHLKFKDQFLT
ncbi:MAG: glucokinase [archaeon]